MDEELKELSLDVGNLAEVVYLLGSLLEGQIKKIKDELADAQARISSLEDALAALEN